jgi:hypothetical protein
MARNNEAAKLFVVYWQDKGGRYHCYDAKYPSRDLEWAQCHRSGCLGLYGDRAKRIVIATAKNGLREFPNVLAGREFRRQFEVKEKLLQKELEQRLKNFHKKSPAPKKVSGGARPRF